MRPYHEIGDSNVGRLTDLPVALAIERERESR